MYEEDNYLMLSGIQHYAFCKRQWALIHLEQQWEENYRTVSGKIIHEKAHREDSVEKRGNLLIVRGLWIASSTLRVSGQCDVVEFYKSPDGISLTGREGLWNVVPVEYKRGQPKDGEEDILQLCAQAICLEEMLLTQISKGYLYYDQNRRRTEVIFTQEQRDRVKELCKEMHQMFEKSYTPIGKKEKKCMACSLNEICMPGVQKRSVSSYIEEIIEEGGNT